MATQTSSETSEQARDREDVPMSYSQIMEQKISSMLQEALRLHREGDPQASITKLTRAIALEPRNAELFKQRAEAYVSLGDYHSAILNFKKAVSLSPGEGEGLRERLATVHYLHGQALSEGREYERALEMFRKAAEYRPDEKEYTMRRIGCLLSLQRYDECLEMVRVELEADDTDPHLYALRAQLNLLFGNATQAYHDACSALALDPTHSEATQLKRQLEEKALTCKNQAVQYSLVGKRVEALKRISTAIESDPAVAEYHILRGALHRRMGDFTAAVDNFLLAMDKCGHRQDCSVYTRASRQLTLTYNDFAVECFQKQHFQEAVTLLNKAIKEEKREKGLYLNRGDCFYRLNSLHFALADYQQALELDPGNWSIQCRIAVVCCELGVESFGRREYSEAEEHFSAAINHNPKVSRFYFCRARARHETKDRAGTKEDLLAALLLDPSNEECIPLIARVFPGKSKADLLQGSDAQAAAMRLEAMGRTKSPLKVQREESSPIVRDLLGVGVRFALEGAESEGCCVPPQQLEERTASQPPQRLEESIKSEDGCSSEVSPQLWAVLEQPLPAVGGGRGEGVIPSLKTCMQENEFHSLIYYSKKNCTDEVERVLRSPTELGSPPPRIQTVHDVRFGGRTVVSGNTLLRMTKNK